ncbi:MULTISPECIES: LeuD/DmdB family oxidoreductase small subunit [Cupriavidus]|uniref:Alpha-IPM isomerase n=1 Tax=Cupriavidus campinensis TaxID=151783 RepID=A0AAE9L526_9BURK|nr:MULTISPECIES: alpha-IPM isomerase [Cupriavidus]TSP11859.1 alpha-IPM isomerase [Cupriavidus campinensis]URF07513.1 alpha-IPM isomerase [Cupriavidus campinensis]
MNSPLPAADSRSLVIEGRARRLGDDINTDYIIASSRKKHSVDPHMLRHFLLEDLDPDFAGSVRDGDILVAGHNFGCGSAMEVAVTVVLAAGIRVVVAKSFARTYWRNAVNNGLLLITADTGTDTGAVPEGAPLSLRLAGAQATLHVGADAAHVIACEPVPDVVLTIREAGGLVPYLRQHRQFLKPSRPVTAITSQPL